MSVHEGSKWQEMKEDGKLFEKLKKVLDESTSDDLGLKEEKSTKTLNNTTASQAKDNVKDIKFWGNGDTFKLISKASSEAEGWMKSTKAMEIPLNGCVVQVTTQQRNIDGTYSIAESLTYVPGVKIQEELDVNGGVVISRKLVNI